jgi:hypothetical protein
VTRGGEVLDGVEDEVPSQILGLDEVEVRIDRDDPDCAV